MNAAVNPVKPPAPAPAARVTTPFEDGLAANRAKAAKAAADAKAKAAKTSDTPADTTPAETPADGKDSGSWFGTIWGKIKSFFSSFSEEGGIGKIIGGVVGLGGAWFASNFFGGGILSTVLMIALAIPFMLAGSDAVGGWINGFLGGSKKTGAGDSPEQGKDHGPAVAKTKDDLNHKLYAIQVELEAYNNVAQRRVRAGQLKDITLEQLRGAETAQRAALETIRNGIPQAASAADIKKSDDQLNVIADGLHNLLVSKPEMQAEVRNELKAIRRSGTSRGEGAAPASASSGPAKALTNEELNAIIAAPDNLKDRVKIIRGSNNALNVVSVADSVADGPGIFAVSKLRASVQSPTSGQVAGIVFRYSPDDNQIRTSALPMAVNSSTPPRR